MRVAVLLISTLALAGCVSDQTGAATGATVSQQAEAPAKPVVLSAAQTEMVKSGLRDVLKDPDSAKFGKMLASGDIKNGITVCGYVNSKNSYGGYVGMSPFLGVLAMSSGKFVVVGIAHDDVSLTATQQVCAKNGLNV